MGDARHRAAALRRGAALVLIGDTERCAAPAGEVLVRLPAAALGDRRICADIRRAIARGRARGLGVVIAGPSVPAGARRLVSAARAGGVPSVLARWSAAGDHLGPAAVEWIDPGQRWHVVTDGVVLSGVCGARKRARPGARLPGGRPAASLRGLASRRFCKNIMLGLRERAEHNDSAWIDFILGGHTDRESLRPNGQNSVWHAGFGRLSTPF